MESFFDCFHLEPSSSPAPRDTSFFDPPSPRIQSSRRTGIRSRISNTSESHHKDPEMHNETASLDDTPPRLNTAVGS